MAFILKMQLKKLFWKLFEKLYFENINYKMAPILKNTYLL